MPGIAVDSSLNAFVAGSTDSPDFPLANLGTFNPTQWRLFLVKLDPTGSNLLFADYFGGTSGNDEAYAISLDSAGNPYITGSAMSTDFPVVNPYQSSLTGSQDAFLTKFSADGSSIVYSTYLGGTNSQISNSVSVDASGEAVIAGVTQSTDFPLSNAYQYSVSTDQFGDWGSYGFLTKFSPDGSSLVYSSYFAGSTLNTVSCTGCSPYSEIMGVVTDGAGNAYVTGNTTTTDFPVTAGAYMTTSPGYYLSGVGFVSKFTNSGALAYSTYLGGNTSSYLSAIAVDTNGSAYVTGYDIADDGFPIVTTNICDPSVENCNGAIVAMLDPTGASLLYSTYLAATNDMEGQAIQVDALGDAFIVGSGTQISLSNPIEGYSGSTDVIVVEIDPTATTQLLATFLGGQQLEAAAQSLALDGNGAVYVTGVTQSPDFPVTQSGYQVSWGGQTDVFVARIDPTDGSALSMGPFLLQFPNQVVGTTSASQTSILRNMGDVAINISSKTVSGDFGETDDCGTAVAAASICTFTIVFTPTALGVRTGALTIVDDAPGSPHSVSLTGTGVGANIVMSPSSLTFPSSMVGTISAPQTVGLTNTGSSAISIGQLQVTGDFAASSNNCGTLAANGGTCSVQITFQPTTSGTRTGTMGFTDSATGNSLTAVLSGSGIDFSTSAVSGSATVNAGGTASYQLSVGSIGGNFTNPVNFTCSGAPALASCTVSPASVTPSGSSSAVTVTVNTAGTVARTHAPTTRYGGFLAVWLSAPGMGILGMLLCCSERRKKLGQYLAVAVLPSILLMFGCAGTSTGGSKSPAAPGSTPPGSYTLVVTGTSGSAHHSTTLTLIVQ